jgi:MFS family permease
MAAGPAFGGYISGIWGVIPLFYLSAFVSLFSILILFRLKETLVSKEPFHFRQLKLGKHEILEKRVFPPSLVLFLSVFSFGIVLTIIPDFSEYLGIENKGLFFAVFTLSSLLIRIVAGKTSDKFGRRPVLMAATLTMAASMTMVALAQSHLLFLLGGVLFGCAVGMNSPTVTAWTIDLSLEKYRGRALATMYIALEAGIGIGAVLSGWIYANKAENFPLVFFMGAGTALVAFVILVVLPKEKRTNSHASIPNQ